MLVSGCSMKVNGFVSDAATGRPIGGARVRIGERSVYTNPTGAYIMKVGNHASADIIVAAPGYETSTTTCVTPDRHPVCDFVLTPAQH